MRIVFLLLAFATISFAEEPKALAEKALAATGWGKTGHATWKDNGKFHFGGQAIEFQSEVFVGFPDKYRWMMQMKLNGVDQALTVVLNGDKGWEASGGKVEELRGEKLAYLLDELLQINVLALKPLVDDKTFELSAIDPWKSEGVAYPGLAAAKKGRPTVKIWFDPKTHLPVRLECKVKNELDGWKEALDEMTIGDWTEADGVKSFKSLKIVRNGTLMIESQCSGYKMPEKVDPKLYEKP